MDDKVCVIGGAMTPDWWRARPSTSISRCGAVAGIMPARLPAGPELLRRLRLDGDCERI